MNNSIKLLTYGMASFHASKPCRLRKWQNSCFEFSEKPEAVFWEIRGKVFCSYVEDGFPRIQQVGQSQKSKRFIVLKLDIETMTFEKTGLTYTKKKVRDARRDFRDGKLKSMFLTNEESLY